MKHPFLVLLAILTPGVVAAETVKSHRLAPEHSSGYDVKADQFNDVNFAPVKTTAMRIQVQLKPGWSGGICEWEVN